MNLSLNFYTQWYWKTDLHNLLHFLSLRADPHAQYEIRVYAEAMLDTVSAGSRWPTPPFLEYRLNAATISASGLAVIRRMLAGENRRSAIERPLPARMARADGRFGD
jgi:thymidylate synthase (FAD)